MCNKGIMSGLGTQSQQALAKKFFDPFFNWSDDKKLRAWLAEQDPDELEQFLNWFNFRSRRDRETLGRQELQKLRLATTAESTKEVLILRPTFGGFGIDLKALWKRASKIFKR
jgi:hypothetical protein